VKVVFALQEEMELSQQIKLALVEPHTPAMKVMMIKLMPCGVVKVTTSSMFLKKSRDTRIACKSVVKKLPMMLPIEFSNPNGLQNAESPLRMANALKNSRIMRLIK
jgi:hypothetical protein